MRARAELCDYVRAVITDVTNDAANPCLGSFALSAFYLSLAKEIQKILPVIGYGYRDVREVVPLPGLLVEGTTICFTIGDVPNWFEAKLVVFDSFTWSVRYVTRVIPPVGCLEKMEVEYLPAVTPEAILRQLDMRREDELKALDRSNNLKESSIRNAVDLSLAHEIEMPSYLDAQRRLALGDKSGQPDTAEIRDLVTTIFERATANRSAYHVVREADGRFGLGYVLPHSVRSEMRAAFEHYNPGAKYPDDGGKGGTVAPTIPKPNNGSDPEETKWFGKGSAATENKEKAVKVSGSLPEEEQIPGEAEVSVDVDVDRDNGIPAEHKEDAQ